MPRPMNAPGETNKKGVKKHQGTNWSRKSRQKTGTTTSASRFEAFRSFDSKRRKDKQKRTWCCIPLMYGNATQFQMLLKVQPTSTAHSCCLKFFLGVTNKRAHLLVCNVLRVEAGWIGSTWLSNSASTTTRQTKKRNQTKSKENKKNQSSQQNSTSKFFDQWHFRNFVCPKNPCTTKFCVRHCSFFFSTSLWTL